MTQRDNGQRRRVVALIVGALMLSGLATARSTSEGPSDQHGPDTVSARQHHVQPAASADDHPASTDRSAPAPDHRQPGAPADPGDAPEPSSASTSPGSEMPEAERAGNDAPEPKPEPAQAAHGETCEHGGSPGILGLVFGTHHPSCAARASYADRYAAATEAERMAADTLIAQVTKTLAGLSDPRAARAAGYRSPLNPLIQYEHWRHKEHRADGVTLDPTKPEGLMFYDAPGGDRVLLGAFFIADPGVEAPMPGGDLVVWHSHDSSCPAFHVTEEDPCTGTVRMLHVWTFDELDYRNGPLGKEGRVRLVDPFGSPGYAAVEPVEPSSPPPAGDGG